MYNAKIIADSISESKRRITTIQVTFPRIVLAEGLVHKIMRFQSDSLEYMEVPGIGFNDFSYGVKNSASSRARSITKVLAEVKENPFIPERFPINQKGMQSDEFYELGSQEYNECVVEWLEVRNNAVQSVEKFLSMNVHKQITNRLLEPFSWHTVCVTATDFDNSFHQRTHSAAQLEIRRAAELMKTEYDNSTPEFVQQGQWHLPYIDVETHNAIWLYSMNNRSEWENVNTDSLGNYDYCLDLAKKISAARVAGISYLMQEGKRDIESDLNLFNRLMHREEGSNDPKHWSVVEHIATPIDETYICEKLSKACLSEEIHDAAYKGKMRSGVMFGWRTFREELGMNCRSFKLGECWVNIRYDMSYVETVFWDNAKLISCSRDDQQDTANELGYSTIEEVNREHDFLHTYLAVEQGLPFPPNLRGVSIGVPISYWQAIEEEKLVLSFQKYLNGKKPDDCLSIFPDLEDLKKDVISKLR